MTQTTLDLRAAVAARRAQAVQSPMFTGNGPAPESAPQRREFTASTNQINMIKDMFFERYPEQEAKELFEAIDWNKVDTRNLFQAIFQGLKKTPRLPKKTAPVVVDQAPAPLMEGIFTVEFEDGTYKTLRVRRQGEDANFRPGQLLLAFLSGQDNVHSYTNFGEVSTTGQVKIWFKHRPNTVLAEAVKVLVGDQVACAKAYARHSAHCSFCNRPLTTPESLDAGYGRTCAEKHGLPWG